MDGACKNNNNDNDNKKKRRKKNEEALTHMKIDWSIIALKISYIRRLTTAPTAYYREEARWGSFREAIGQ